MQIIGKKGKIQRRRIVHDFARMWVNIFRGRE